MVSRPADPPAPATLEAANIANQNAQAAFYRNQVAQPAPPAKQDLPGWLNAVLPIVALVVGSFLTYVVAARQVREAQKRLYDRQKTQVRAAVRDLATTLQGLRLENNRPLDFLQERFLVEQPERPRLFHRNDPFYQKYDFVDLVYRLCAVLGWMELYRVDPTFLSGSADDRRAIEGSFRAIRIALGAAFDDEKIAKAPSTDAGATWADGVILDDDQRAIGETMLNPATKDASPAVIGYAAFCVHRFRFAARDPVTGSIRVGDQDFWIWNATRFVIDMGSAPPAEDFRRERLKKVLRELGKLDVVLGGRPADAGAAIREKTRETEPR